MTCKRMAILKASPHNSACFGLVASQDFFYPFSLKIMVQWQLGASEILQIFWNFHDYGRKGRSWANLEWSSLVSTKWSARSTFSLAKSGKSRFLLGPNTSNWSWKHWSIKFTTPSNAPKKWKSFKNCHTFSLFHPTKYVGLTVMIPGKTVGHDPFPVKKGKRPPSWGEAFW